MEQWIDILSECPIFKNLSRQEMTKIFGDACYTMEEFEKKAVIYRAGDEARRIGIIAKGCLEMRKYLSTGNVLSMFQRKCGEMIGGGMAFSSHPYYPCDVIAKEKSLVIWIERKVILRIFLENETVARNILRISADRIMMFEKRIELFSFYSIRKKKIVFSLLHDFKMDETQTVQLPFSKTTWAQYLNVSRTSLSRELRTLCTQGILAMEEKKIRILQPGRMQDLLYLEEQSGSVRTDYAYNLLCDILSVLEVDDMARGVRRSIDDQIAALDTVMEKTQEKLDKLKRERNELLGKKKEEMVREVTDLIQGAGISVEQLRQIIEQEIQKEQTA